MNGSLCACSEPRAYFDSLPPELTWGGYRERIMYGRIAFSALAVVTLIAAAMPAAAGQSTGTWKYWKPNMAYAAPPHWQHPHYGGHPGLALRAPSAPALRTCLLARLPPPSGLVS